MKFTKNNQEVIRETSDITNVSHIQAGEKRFVLDQNEIKIISSLKNSGSLGTFTTYSSTTYPTPSAVISTRGNGSIVLTLYNSSDTSYTSTVQWFSGTPNAYPYSFATNIGSNFSFTLTSSGINQDVLVSGAAGTQDTISMTITGSDSVSQTISFVINYEEVGGGGGGTTFPGDDETDLA